MAYHDHLSHEISFQQFTDDQQMSHQGRDMQQRMMPLSAPGGGTAPTWLNNAAALRQQNFLHLQPDSAAQNDDVVRGLMEKSGGDRDHNHNGESEDLAEYKADILGHPLYDQLLSAHVSCLRIATPVDQLPRIDAQLQQAQRVVDKYSRLGNGVVDEKELDQFMVLTFFYHQSITHISIINKTYSILIIIIVPLL